MSVQSCLGGISRISLRAEKESEFMLINKKNIWKREKNIFKPLSYLKDSEVFKMRNDVQSLLLNGGQSINLLAVFGKHLIQPSGTTLFFFCHFLPFCSSPILPNITHTLYFISSKMEEEKIRET